MPEAPHDPGRADPVRAELLRAAAEALAGAPPGAAALLAPLFAAVPTAELAARSPEALAEAAASLAGFAARRAPGEVKLRLAPPGAGRGPAALVEIVNDDMPFLVDSVLAALVRTGRAAREFLHPVLGVRRDAAGRLLGVAPDAPRESWMRIALSPAAVHMLPAQEPADWPGVEAALRRALADVRAAVADFPAMAARLEAAAGECGGGEEAEEFLRWLREENFVLLGHRLLRLEGEGARVEPEENLGLLRDPSLPVFDALRALPALPAPVRAALAEAPPVGVVKANMRSTVHRPQHADVIVTRRRGAGGTPGVRLFLGLFAAAAYNRNPRSIPLLRGKVERILAASGIPPFSHDGRALRNILDTWPRDELFQAEEAEILAGARLALDLALRPRPALFSRRDPFGRFVSVIAWLPRESFDTRLRERVGGMLARAHGGRLSAFHIALGDAPLARVHYIIGTDPDRPVHPDPVALERAVAEAARSFGERLAEALAAERGELAAAELLAAWRDAFPPAYRETHGAAQAAADLALAEAALRQGGPAAALAQPPGAGTERILLRLAVPGGALALADALPLFHSLDLRALEEVPHRLAPQGLPAVTLHLFQLDAGTPFDPARGPLLLEALGALLQGRAEADGFNRLVLREGLSWRECWLLRALARWLRQLGFPPPPESIAEALCATPGAAALLVALFRARFDPEAASREEAALEARWAALLDAVENPETDRILARLRAALEGLLRTNFFQEKPWLALKFDPARAGEMPSPRPWREIFVHSPAMEGCHLRAGPVARGGIRWSDRREDFRTEILGLMKAQRLKNAVIVPTGAKGGFVLKGPVPAEREALQAAGVAAYRTLIRGMLDLTDNLRGAEVVPPPRVLRRDGDDPYIVAAADKGTASFSDIANALAAEYGFWLGDAFASGGSAGYDHKAMGITARGAWVMIERHFQEALGRSIHDEPFDMAGVGDMSGDVFGNGLLISRQARLRAAFDHRNIFLDPDPDPAASHAERARLFALPRSSWADYDARLISRGGGVFPRTLKAIPLSPEAREMLGLAAERASPAEVMRAILTMPVDLLYFGGIGTFVKASGESHAEAGDRANDAIRVDGRALRARVVGEGANLGLTQAGRIEAARLGNGGAGVRLNTDALDNSAGVSTSDREVNIKILLADAEAEGVITRRQRDELLAAMTEEVAALVLRDNAAQSLAVSLEAMAGAAALPGQAALMARLEAAGLLDRAQLVLPDAAGMAAREAAGEGLTRPEIAALLPVAKLWLTEALAESALPEDPVFAPLLAAYFPTPLREARFAPFLARHRLRRELIATALANLAANRLGCAALGRLTAGMAPAEAVGAAWLAAELLGLEAGFEAAESLPAAERLPAQAALRRRLEEAAEALGPGPVGARWAALAPGVAALREAEGAPPAAAPLIVALAEEAGVPPAAARQAWAAVGEAFHLEALREALGRAPLPGPFADRARAALRAELRAAQRRLAAAALAGRPAAGPAAEEARHLLQEATRLADIAAATVALRALAALG
ncbi:MAG: NAD-glutamate dehydrogenase [Roseococcus sp.]|nr:NAD-glutamate dehydrogenase [Roseococcus sp.]